VVIWEEVQTCIWPSRCHCHSLSLAPVNSDWFYLPGFYLSGCSSSSSFGISKILTGEDFIKYGRLALRSAHVLFAGNNSVFGKSICCTKCLVVSCTVLLVAADICRLFLVGST